MSGRSAERPRMRLRQLRAALHDFCEEAACQLASDAQGGHEMPFEIVESGRRGTPLYCYRPLTADFIRGRTGVLARLPSYLPAAHALISAGNLGAWLDAQGVHTPSAGRERADCALHCFLARVFADATDFVFSEERFDGAFRELIAIVADGRTESVVVAVLPGFDLGSDEVAIGEGLALARGEACDDAPDEARWSRPDGAPQTLALLRWEPAPGDPAPLSYALVRLRRLLLGLRLYDTSAVALAPLGWTRTGGGAWQPIALGSAAAVGGDLLIEAEQEDELRAFLNLVARRTPKHGELAWALRRFELACERPQAAEALTDALLALRALLEPEGPGAGRLAGRLATLCAEPHDRPRLAERIAHAVSLERAIVAGLAVDPELEAIVSDVTEHLRALLRDVLCGHLDPDLAGLADKIAADEAKGREPGCEPGCEAEQEVEAPRPSGPAQTRQDTFF